jgi:hypothetical protein
VVRLRLLQLLLLRLGLRRLKGRLKQLSKAWRPPLSESIPLAQGSLLRRVNNSSRPSDFGWLDRRGDSALDRLRAVDKPFG